MSDINSLIANYLQSNGSTADISDVADRIKDLGSSVDWSSLSIFSYGEDEVASEDEFLAFMSQATGKDSEEIADDVGLLFDILNTESDDDVLSSDELSILESKTENAVTGFKVWNQLTSIDEDKIQSILDDNYEAEKETEAEDEIDLTEYYDELSAASSEDERDKIYAAIMQQIESEGLTGSALSDCLSQVIQSVQTSQSAEIEALQEKLEDAQGEDAKAALNAEINKKTAEFNSELNQYQIEYNQSSSNLTEEQSNVLKGLYEDLSNAKTPQEREAVLSEIMDKQEEYNMDDNELSISSNQIINSTYASYSDTIADLYEELSEAEGTEAQNALKAQISQVNAEYNQEINQYEIVYNQSLSSLSDEQSNELTALYKELSNSGSQEERDEITARIQEKQEEYNMNSDELSLSNMQITSCTLGSYSGEIAGLYEKLSETKGTDARAAIQAEITEKLSEYNAYLESQEE